jgi:hypothetical protein
MGGAVRIFCADVEVGEYGMEEIGEEEMTASLLSMLKAMMAFKPGNRMTAEQITESEWMK